MTDIIRNATDWRLGVPRHTIVHQPTGLLFALAPADDERAACDCIMPDDFVCVRVNEVPPMPAPEEMNVLLTEAKFMALLHYGIILPVDITPASRRKPAPSLERQGEEDLQLV